MNHQPSLLDKKVATTILPRFPSTRYQGSKRKILDELHLAFNEIEFQSALDLYSGSASVSLLLRHMGKNVDSNDYLLYNANTADVFLNYQFNSTQAVDHENNLAQLLERAPLTHEQLVSKNFESIFFKNEENIQIDRFCQNIYKYPHQLISLYIYAVGQALLKKRPYNLFHRKNLDMRLKDVKRSFGNAKTWETSILEHALKAIYELDKFPFNSNQEPGTAYCLNTNNLSELKEEYDLVYLDPPYLNSKNVSVDYSDFYGFLDGLVDYNLYRNFDDNYSHKPICKKPSNWDTSANALRELEQAIVKWRKSIIFLSYRNNGTPTLNQITEVLSRNNRRVVLHSTEEYKYALSHASDTKEIFIISLP